MDAALLAAQMPVKEKKIRRRAPSMKTHPMMYDPSAVSMDGTGVMISAEDAALVEGAMANSAALMMAGGDDIGIGRRTRLLTPVCSASARSLLGLLALIAYASMCLGAD